MLCLFVCGFDSLFNEITFLRLSDNFWSYGVWFFHYMCFQVFWSFSGSCKEFGGVLGYLGVFQKVFGTFRVLIGNRVRFWRHGGDRNCAKGTSPEIGLGQGSTVQSASYSLCAVALPTHITCYAKAQTLCLHATGSSTHIVGCVLAQSMCMHAERLQNT